MILRLALAPLRTMAPGAWLAIASSLVAGVTLTAVSALYGAEPATPAHRSESTVPLGSDPSESRWANAERQVLSDFSPAAAVLTGVVLLTCALCLSTSLVGLLIARRAQIALMAALGATRRQISGIVAAETASYVGAGGFAGVLLGEALAVALARGVFQLGLEVSWQPPVFAATALAVIAILSLAVPIRRLPHLIPSEALRGE